MTTLIKDSEAGESANKLLVFLTFSFNLHLEHPGSGPPAIKKQAIIIDIEIDRSDVTFIIIYFSCLDHTFPVHLFYQLYMQETGNLNITGLVQ